MSYEDVATLAQKYVCERPAIILGCGASIPHGLPSMSQLADNLCQEVPRIFEGILPTEWQEFTTRLEQTGDLEVSLQDVSLDDKLLECVVKQTWTYVNELDFEVYRKLIRKSSKSALARLLSHLLNTSNPLVDIVTTNYDRLAEYAADLAGANTYTGFSPGRLGTYAHIPLEKAKVRYPGIHPQVNVLKVHGSLDWFTKTNSQPIRVPQSLEVPAGLRPSIVTPGIRKYEETHNDPYRGVMSNADIALQRAKSFLCVGYGFNDRHVQPKLIQRVQNQNVPVIVVTKRLSDSGRRLLLNGKCKNYLIIEELDGGGSIVYSHASPGGEQWPEREAWQFPEFVKMVL